MSSADLPLFTIGHSNRTLGQFLDLVSESGIELIVDVRRVPGSTRYPQFNADILASSLDEASVSFRRLEGLTGRRPASKEVPFEVNAWWENRSFHNFADHALSEEFRSALNKLREWARSQRTAVMCSEVLWWRCHRRIIADHLLAHREDVRHIVKGNHVESAQLSAGAVVGPDASVTYPAVEKEHQPSDAT
ncbi:MAG TPA: DUF488 domain-containing protein [Actinomycetes bacterium]|nr:DUF488 domain-containing protein [Actinomycetes bacterium]